jgi:hypothetical protein
MKTTWDGYNVKELEIEGKHVWIAIPEKPNENRDFAFKTEYWGAFPNVETRLVDAGFHIVGVRNETRFAPDSDLDREARIFDILSEKYGLNRKCVPLGMSLGAAHALRFAGRHPDRVKCMWIDAPCTNYFYCPASFDRYDDVFETEFQKAFPNTKCYELLGSKINPVFAAETMIEYKIPLIMTYGTLDTILEYNYNGRLLEEAFEAHPELLTVIPVSLRGHHPHGLMHDNTPIVDFILKNTGNK